MLEIIVTQEPPKALIEIAEQELKDITTVEALLFEANFLKDKGTGAFFPEDKIIVIDPAECMSNFMFMRKGMMYIPSVWFNMLWALYHEAAHARQFMVDPNIDKTYPLPVFYEHAADLEARAKIGIWADGNPMPKLDDMGWVGKELKKMINLAYTQPEGDNLMAELDVYNTNGIGFVDMITAYHETIDTNQYTSLCEAVDKGDVGMIVDGKRCLDAKGFFSID